MNKVQLKVWISKDLDERMRRFIAQKYAFRRRSQLSGFVQNAIENHLAIMNTQQHSTQNLQRAENRIQKVVDRWLAICKYVADNNHGYVLEEGKDLPRKMFNDAVYHVCGLDDRTLRKWTKIFVTNGFIKEINLGKFEVLRGSEFVFMKPIKNEDLR